MYPVRDKQILMTKIQNPKQMQSGTNAGRSGYIMSRFVLPFGYSNSGFVYLLWEANLLTLRFEFAL